MMEILRELLINLGLNKAWAVALSAALGLAGSLLLGYLLHSIVKKMVYSLAQPAREWQDALKARHAGRGVAWVLAILLCYELVLPLMSDWPWLQGGLGTVFNGLLVLLVVLSISRFIAATIAMLESRKAGDGGQRMPFKVLGQALQIVLWSYGSIVLLSVLTDRDVSSLLTGMTAVGAVLVYVFRDSILGWVAGVQIAGNDLARHGDWITMPGHGADGEVIDIALTTIKVRNWDKTISTIPSYALVSEGFCNWRGMTESGGRRIKRKLAIDIGSVSLCDASALEQLSLITPVREVLERGDMKAVELTGSCGTTNLGYYRRWLQAWIRQQPGIQQEMMAMVRELEPEGRGIYLEIYAFSSDTRWEHYEQLQADLYDYALAVLPEFGLRAFQQPSGSDLQRLQQPGVLTTQ